MATRALILIGLLLGPAPLLRADPGLIIPVRGDLDSEVVEEIAAELRVAPAEGTRFVLFDVATNSADPDACMALAEAIRGIPDDVRTAAYITGSSPGATLAAVLACEYLWAGPRSVLGPAKSEGPIRSGIDRELANRGIPGERVQGLFSPQGLPADKALKAGLLNDMFADRASAISSLGVDLAGTRVWVRPGTITTGWQPRLTPSFKNPYLIPIEQVIDETLFASVERRIEQAVTEGADLIIFVIDSPGGMLFPALDLGDLIYELEVPSLVMIFDQAISAAALISMAADEIVMKQGALIGDCQPILPTSTGYEVAGEKIQTVLRTVFRKYADKNSYPIALAEAMVTEEMQVERVVFQKGRTVFYASPDQVDELAAEHGRIASRKTVVPAGRLLTFRAEEARDNDFCGPPVISREEAFLRYGLDEKSVVRLEETWAERSSRFLMGIKLLLFLAGIVGLYMEIKVPGFGVPGAISLICFGLFFTASAVAGIGTGIEVVLFILGVCLLLVEVLLIPGFGIPGIAGFVLILLSLYMGSVKYAFPSEGRPWDANAFGNWLFEILVALFGAVLIGAVLAKLLPKTSLGRRIMLSPEGPAGSRQLTGSGSVAGDRARDLVGRSGLALTDLRPAGRIEVDGEPLDAVTRGGYVERGTPVEVIEVKGNRIVVREV